MSNVSYQPAEKVQIHLQRAGANVSWGFRLQGGTDFQTPLSIQSVCSKYCYLLKILSKCMFI